MAIHDTALVRRATVEDIVAKRNRAIDLYGIALQAIIAADVAVKAAHRAASEASPGVNSYNHNSAKEVEAFRDAVKLPDTDQYLRVARRLVDIDVWSWIIQHTELERLMDKEAKDQLRAQMAYIPERTRYGSTEIINQDEIDRGLPEVTVETVMATLEKFRGEADMIFRRGIANAFSKLDRRFKSHDGFKVGSRIIIDRLFDDNGWWSYGGGGRDTLMDIERTFAILDGKTVGESYATTIGAIDSARGGSYGARQTEIATEYFKIRVFKNGNAHLWLLRDDLARKVNKLLAEFYGEVVGDGQQAEEDPLANKKTTPARYFGFFPTPEAAVGRLLREFPLHQEKSKPRLRILEPSAGTGNLARRCADLRWRFKDNSGGIEAVRDRYHLGHQVDCVEVQPHLAEGLRAEGIYARVFSQDFLTLKPGTTGLYDRVVMNPPFDRERDIDHIVHALEFLKPDGCLTAILSAGTEFRETKKATAFRALMERLSAKWSDLPAGSFSEVGTYVNTITLTVWKSGKPGSRW